MTAASRVVVVGASAGGVEALTTLVRGLPADLPAAVLVALHIAPTGHSVLGDILDRAGRLEAAAALDGEPIAEGRVYVAPPDRHMLVDGGHLRLDAGPRENGHRPAIDPLFRSAAASFDERVVGVILSGTRDDGTAGLAEVKRGGGVCIVQDPEDSSYPGMPQSAIDHVAVDHVLPAARLAAAIAALVRNSPPGGSGRPASITDGDLTAHDDPGDEQAVITRLVCPECGGSLVERQPRGVLQFRCHVGHVYSAQSMMGAQGEAVEKALWTAVRSLEDRAIMLRRMTKRAESSGHAGMAALYRRRAAEADEHADAVGTLIETQDVLAPAESGEPS